MSGTWSEENDIKLWSLRSKPTSQLATKFNKTAVAIRSRLKHLQDPSHKAYQRRVKNSAGSIAQSSAFASSSRSSSYMSPFATGYLAAAVALSQQKRSGAISSSSGRTKKKPKSCNIGVIDLTDDDAAPFTSKYIAAKTSSSHSSTRSINNQSRINPSTLNSDQQSAAQYIFAGGNAFLTGAAGVGKSYLLNYLIQGLRDKHGGGEMTMGGGRYTKSSSDPAVVVAAATGIAATHINGVTIHSWSGVRLGAGGPRTLVPRVLQNEAACQRWRKARVLVLDEVSMIDGELFNALDAIGREVRKCHSKPFGGIQLVLSGDFFQLPPVSLNKCGFAFESPAWRNAAVKMVELRTVVRQSGDQTFINLLNQIRVGQCPVEITNVLEACHVSRKALPTDGIVPTKLYCTNKNVDEENDRKLALLPGKEVLFTATDDYKGNYNQSVRNTLSQALDKKMPSEIRLKVGAQVILTRNMPERRLVNGSRGVVKGFCSESQKGDMSASQKNEKLFPVVVFSNGVKMMVSEESQFQGGASGAMTRLQLPLKLAWSLTVHKSQGMTIERAELQLDDAFDFGQVYVALSRITSLDGLWVRGGRVTQSVVKAHPKVKTFYQQNGQQSFGGTTESTSEYAAARTTSSATLASHTSVCTSAPAAFSARGDNDLYDDIFDL